MIITLDGPAGTGKTTVAKNLASALSYHYFDTGAIYRAFTLYVLNQNITVQEAGAIKTALETFDFDIDTKNNEYRYFLSGKDVTQEIRSVAVTQNVSQFSAILPIRQRLVAFQREFAKEKKVVFEGRDLGTVVFPNADLKFFLTASSEIRAERRFFEMYDRKPTSKENEEMMKKIESRDTMDAHRQYSPLKKAEDAIAIDTSFLTVDEVIQQIMNRCEQL